MGPARRVGTPRVARCIGKLNFFAGVRVEYAEIIYYVTSTIMEVGGLKINTLAKLAVVGLADRYTNKQEYDAAEYYAPPEDEWAGYEEDNNEP